MTTLPPPRKDNIFSSYTSKKLSSGAQAPDTRGTIWKIMNQSQKSSSQQNTSTKNILPISKRSKGLDNTKEKKSNTLQHVTVGPTSTIGQFISTEQVHRRHPIARPMTTQPASNNYWKERKQPFLWPFRNSKLSVDQLVLPYEQDHPAPKPQFKQVRFLLHLCRKERHQPQYHLEPEPLPPVSRYLKPAHPRDLYRLHYHSQQHHNRLQVLHHLTHQQPEPWLNRTNPAFWEQP